MENATIGITARTVTRPARLRADGIQRTPIIQLAVALAEGDVNARDLLDALEDLGRLAQSNVRDGELDAAFDDVATYARLDAAVMDLSDADVAQLAEQAAAALPGTGTVHHLPAQPERRRTA